MPDTKLQYACEYLPGAGLDVPVPGMVHTGLTFSLFFFLTFVKYTDNLNFTIDLVHLPIGLISNDLADTIFVIPTDTVFSPCSDDSILDENDSDKEQAPMEQDPPAQTVATADPPPKGLGSVNNKPVDSPPQGADNPSNTDQNTAAQCGTKEGMRTTGAGFNENLYCAIRNLRATSMAPRQLGSASELPLSESLVAGAVTNKDIGYYRHVYDSKMNICFSFEPRCLVCHSCEGSPHHILGDEYRPACIILSDQSFPAALPATDKSFNCPTIIRIEDGTLGDLLSCFRKTLGKVRLPVGSIIMISSISHLSRVGVAAYASDLQGILNSIEEDYGSRVRAVHGLPLPSEDLEDGSLARALLDVMDWLENVDKRAKYHLVHSTHALRELYLTGSGGSAELAQARLHYRLPVGIRTREMAVFMAGGCCRLPDTVPAITGSRLHEIVGILTEELNGTFAVNLDAKPNLAASNKGGGRRGDITVVVVGSSHGSRLVSALENKDVDLVDMTKGGWTLSGEKAEVLAEELANQLEDLDGQVVVIMQLFDNAIFFGRDKGGNRISPKKQDGIFHIEGELDSVSKEEMKGLFEAAAPIFRAAKGVPTIVLGPVVRYIIASCCDNPEHISNICDADYSPNQAGSVQVLGRYLRQLVWHRRWRNVTVVNTGDMMGICGSVSVEEAVIRMKDVSELWGVEDPVHPTKKAYENLAAGLMDLLKAKLADNEEGDNAPRGLKRPREEKTGRRPDWTVASATAVSRRGAGPHTGANREQSWSGQRAGRYGGMGAGNGDKSSSRGGGGSGASGYGGRGGGGSSGWSGSGSGSSRGGGGGGGPRRPRNKW